MNIHLQALPERFLRRVREEGIDDQGQEVHRICARGGEPCRDVLRRARPGEEIILASHCPFDRDGPYKEYGPVFVLAAPSNEPVCRDRLPLDDGREQTYFRGMFTLRAYNTEGAIADAALVTNDNALPVLDAFLRRTDVDFVDARFPTYGCFACRIVRR